MIPTARISRGVGRRIEAGDLVQFATDAVFFGGPGALIHVALDGKRTTITTDLFQPTGVTVGRDGAIYLSNKGTFSGAGEVLKFVLGT